MNQRKKDHFGKRATMDGYPARSVYKLEEIDRRVRLFRHGMRVLDLGASPGSWSMYAAKKVGGQGFVLSCDIKAMQLDGYANIEARVCDVFETSFSADGPFDSVISDMAPNTTGKRDVDQYRSYELVMRAAEVAERELKPGGSFVAKIFQGAEFEDARARLRELFGKVRIIRPKATRDVSYEVFLVGEQKK